MDKHTRAEPGSRIRRAGRKIAKFRVKGERNEPTELGIYGFDGRIRVFQIEPRPHAVQPQVVLFIYHHADLVLHQQRRSWPRARLAFQTGQLLTHEMAFMQDLPIGAFHLIEPERDGRPKMVGGGRRFVHPVENRRAVLVFGPLAERNTANVAGQANAGGQDDGRFRTCGIEPAHAAVREQGEVHYSSTRMRSLSSAASSKFSPSTARRSWALRSSSRTRGSLALAPSPGISYRSPTCWLEPCSRRSRSRRWTSNETEHWSQPRRPQARTSRSVLPPSGQRSPSLGVGTSAPPFPSAVRKPPSGVLSTAPPVSTPFCWAHCSQRWSVTLESCSTCVRLMMASRSLQLSQSIRESHRPSSPW